MTTLPSNGTQWVIIFLETYNDSIFFNYYQSITYSANINDIYPIEVIKMPTYITPPSENPKEWNISGIIKDIELNR